MSARGRYWPNSNTSRILEWLRAHPGLHTVKDIAAAVFPDDDPNKAHHRTAIACRQMWVRGDVVRSDPVGVRGSGLRRGLYGAVPERGRYLTMAETVPSES